MSVMNIFRNDVMMTNGGPSDNNISRVKYAKISAAADGDNTVVSAVTGKKIRVLSISYASAGAGAHTWKSGSTDISGAIGLLAGVQLSNASSFGLMETASGEALIVNNAAGVDVLGFLSYVEVNP